MKLPHFIGGLEGFGPAEFDPHVFKHPWEKRVFGMAVALFAQGIWTGADLRTGIEGLEPKDYLEWGYYERWLESLVSHLLGTGILKPEELIGHEGKLSPLREKERAPTEISPLTQKIIGNLRKGKSVQRDRSAEPLFREGEKVAVRQVPLADHTRLPGYLRGKSGLIEKVYPGAYVYADTGADGLGNPQPVYRVRFDSLELWGDRGGKKEFLLADLYETYLEPFWEKG